MFMTQKSSQLYFLIMSYFVLVLTGGVFMHLRVFRKSHSFGLFDSDLVKVVHDLRPDGVLVLVLRTCLKRSTRKHWPTVGSGCDSVASDTRSPWFESSHWRNITNLLAIKCIEKTKIKKKLAGNGPSSWQSVLIQQIHDSNSVMVEFHLLYKLR